MHRHARQKALRQKTHTQAALPKPLNAQAYSEIIQGTKIELLITQETFLKEAGGNKENQYLACPVCGKEFRDNIQLCPDCNKLLVAVNLRKCSKCGTKNSLTRATCWGCGTALDIPSGAVTKETLKIFNLKVDGINYNSNDEYLAFDIRALFERLEKEGYSRILLEEWLRKRKQNLQIKKETLKFQINNIKVVSNIKRTHAVLAVISVILTIVALIFAFVHTVKN